MATTLAGAFAQGVDASKPSASSSLEGYFYFSTDINGGTLYQCKASAWVQITTGVSALKPNGLTGATAASRFAGGTTSGAPASGTFAVGDFVVDQSGALWVCTVAGTPGTWVSAAGSGVTSITGTANEITASASTGAVTLSTPQAIATTSSVTFKSAAMGGLTGATAASRFAGGTSSGAPASGTFAVGDFIIDQTGKVFICTIAGTPGTWVQVGAATSLYSAYARIEDQKSSGTSGGGLTASTWNQRTLNTIASDASSIVSSLTSNQFTLAAGTYTIAARAPAYQVNRHRIRLRNVTDSTTTQEGINAYGSATAVLIAELRAQFTISGSKTFEIDHNCETTNSSNGAGVDNGSVFTVDHERYTVVEIWKQ